MSSAAASLFGLNAIFMIRLAVVETQVQNTCAKLGLLGTKQARRLRVLGRSGRNDQWEI